MDSVNETGITVIYEPDSGDPIVDIVIIHGLQGHPYKTWAWKTPQRSPPSTDGSSVEVSEDGYSSRKSFHRVVPLFSRKSSALSSPRPKAGPSSRDGGKGKEGNLFWPRNLLPNQYPEARILVYGYDTRVTNYLSRSTNENSVQSHGKDLLASVAASRKPRRPLVLIAHSLGGIIVKQMLASSSTSSETRLKDVVSSTAAVIFLGTPHRGSPHLAALGDRARSMISAFRMRTNSAILDALRLKTRDLEVAQDLFSAVWREHDFRVKTFQEGLGLTGLNLGPLGKKVVPDYSSLLGDDRERAETIQANHMDMCRFSGPDDPNYGRICGEITSIYDSIAKLNTIVTHPVAMNPFITNPLTELSQEVDHQARNLEEHQKTCLHSLSFPNMNQRTQNLENPAEGTCSWFFEHELFTNWLAHEKQTQFCGLLWLRGKMGSGKSTLLKEAFFKTTADKSASQCHTRRALRGEEEMASWEEAELKDFIKTVIIAQKTRILIFIDAIDECDTESARGVVDFWREITKLAYSSGSPLSVCLSSRHYPAITVNDCPLIILENHNHPDIAEYVGRRLDLSMGGTHEDRQAMQRKILERSGGVFLWVSLVVKELLKKRDEGRGLRSLLKDLDSVPRELEDLFSQMLTTEELPEMAARVFQWALLPTKPLRLHEWRHVLAFLGDTPPSSLEHWRESEDYTGTDEELEKRITHVSRGLLAFSIRDSDAVEAGDESMSDRAGAGSLDFNSGETRVVQVIHESVRQFFVGGSGFSVLSPAFGKRAVAHAHLQMMSVCLDYILITELDALVEARQKAQQRVGSRYSKEENAKRYGRESGLSNPHEPVIPTTTGIDRPQAISQPWTHTRLGRSMSVASFGSASSHNSTIVQTPVEIGGQRRKRPFSNDNLSPAPHTRRRMDDGTSSYDDLKRLSGPIALYDVANWRSGGFHSTEETYDHGLADQDPPQPSIAGSSQILEDYPALLSYATSQLFTHARKADAEGLDPTQVIRRLRHGDWNRWKVLQEDIDGHTELLYHAADLGLSSWLQAKDTWLVREAVSAIDQAVESENKKVFEAALEWFPAAGYRVLARSPDAGLLQTYLSQQPPQRQDIKDPIMAADRSLESRDEDGRTPLHLAVIQQNKDVVKVFLKHGADISAVASKLWTPLHLACMNTRPANRSLGYKSTCDDVLGPRNDIIEILLSHHAQINAVDAKGRTPLIMACSNSALPIRRGTDESSSGLKQHSDSSDSNAVDVLLKHGADSNITNSAGLLPLHEACWTGSGVLQSKLPMVSRLLDHGLPVNAVDNKRRTPLHFACCCADRQIVRELLRRGANPLLRDHEGRNALHTAAAWSTEEVVETLLHVSETFMDVVNIADDSGSTALHLACETVQQWHWHNSMRLSIIRQLLAQGAKAYTIRDHHGDSPAHVARRNGLERALDMMKKSSCDAPHREASSPPKWWTGPLGHQQGT